MARNMARNMACCNGEDCIKRIKCLRYKWHLEAIENQERVPYTKASDCISENENGSSFSEMITEKDLK